MENSWGADESMGVHPPFSPGTEKEGHNYARDAAGVWLPATLASHSTEPWQDPLWPS